MDLSKALLCCMYAQSNHLKHLRSQYVLSMGCGIMTNLGYVKVSEVLVSLICGHFKVTFSRCGYNFGVAIYFISDILLYRSMGGEFKLMNFSSNIIYITCASESLNRYITCNKMLWKLILVLLQ